MAPSVSLQLAMLAIAGVLVALGSAITLRRTYRIAVTRRADQRAAALRPTLMRLLSEDEPDLSSLRAITGGEGKLLEALIWQLLSKVRGSSRAALVQLLEDRGAVESARRRTHRLGAVGRAIAAERLGAAGVASTSDDVSGLLDDNHPEVRIVAARALGKLGDARAVPRLLDALEGPKAIPEGVISMALIHIGPGAIEFLIKGLGRNSTRARAVCLELLGIHGAIQATKWIAVIAQNDASDDVRVGALHALGRLGVPQAIQPLVRSTAPENSTAVRLAAIRSLGQIGGSDAVAALHNALNEASDEVGEAAGVALALMGAEGAGTLNVAVSSQGVAAARAEDALARVALQLATRRSGSRSARGRIARTMA